MGQQVESVRSTAVTTVEGSYADQRRKVAGLNQRLQECVLPGDVLRAVGGQHQPLKHWCCVLSAFRMRCPPHMSHLSTFEVAPARSGTKAPSASPAQRAMALLPLTKTDCALAKQEQKAGSPHAAAPWHGKSQCAFVLTLPRCFPASFIPLLYPSPQSYRYGADKQKWSSIRGALKKGDVKDGEVSLVVERRRT
eukprot:scaffold19998_cov16-Tisochrysis_lutea.AAC.1